MTSSRTLDDLIEQLETDAERDRDPEDTPDIGIVMGSDSDLDTMSGAYDALTELGFEEDTGDGTENGDSASQPESGGDSGEGTEERFSFETYVVSAHRTPELMEAYARTAEARGLDVIIAGAGGKSADLPNMTASLAYPLPVIGVPVQEKSVDSVIGMPTGAPLVAVDAGKSFNAALSAVQILSRSHEELRERLVEYHADLQEEVAQVSRDLHAAGTPAYRRKQ